MYRIYCNGIEFGTDYPNLEAARKVKRAYQSDWPHLRYYIRKAFNSRISQLVSKL